jgi:hypothetical protein
MLTFLVFQYTLCLHESMVFQGQDAWRRHPLFLNLWKDPLPGFKKAVLIYGAFLAGEFVYKTLSAPPTNVEAPKAAHD